MFPMSHHIISMFDVGTAIDINHSDVYDVYCATCTGFQALAANDARCGTSATLASLPICATRTAPCGLPCE